MKELYGLFVKMEEEVKPSNENNTTYYNNSEHNYMQPQLNKSTHQKLPEISPQYQKKEKESPGMHYNKY